jgi:hypothetical protein
MADLCGPGNSVILVGKQRVKCCEGCRDVQCEGIILDKANIIQLLVIAETAQRLSKDVFSRGSENVRHEFFSLLQSF